MNPKLLLILLIITILNPACCVTKNTHSEVMDIAVLNKSKFEIANTFGIPNEKKVKGSHEEWIYNLDKNKNSTEPMPKLTYLTKFSPVYYSYPSNRNNYIGNNDVISIYNNNFKIIFKDGFATEYKTQVYYSDYKHDPILVYIVVVTLTMALCIGLGLWRFGV
jgi:hypothetical protein